MKYSTTFFLLFILNFSLFSQWTSNTSVNTIVCDTTGEQALVKIAPHNSDGATYYTWFDNRGGGYAVYINKLNFNGLMLFPPGGILVSNNPQNSSLVDYDLAVDNSGNAIVTFTDIRNGSAINPFAYMISPTGTMLWGANGVSLSDSVNSFQPNPKVAVTSDGNYVFLWILGSGPRKFAMQKLNSAGVKQWGTSPRIITSGTTENYDWPALIPSDNGSVIVMWSGYTGTFLNPQNYRIYTQKFSSAGTRVWNSTQDTVYSLGRVAGFYTPRLFSDSLNGAIYCWRDDRNSLNQQTGHVQRKTSAGVFLFPVNGSPVSTLAGNNHFDPIAELIGPTGELVAFWYESNSLQSQYGVYGQKFSPNGAALWGSSGIAFSPLSGNQPSSFNIAVYDTNAFCYYLETAGGANYLAKAFRVGKSGGFVWSGNIVIPGSLLSSKSRMQAVMLYGISILTWRDGRNDAGGIYAQNIKIDGTFGPFMGIQQTGSEIPQTFSLSQNYPNPFNPTTKIRFNIPSAVAQYIEPVQLVIFDILGREIQTLVNEKLQAGSYEVTFDASKLSSGVYYYKLIAGIFSDTKKMVVVK